MTRCNWRAGALLFATTLLIAPAQGNAQRGLQASDRLQSMPGYARYAEMQQKIPGAARLGAVQGGSWSADSKSFDYTIDNKRMRLDVASLKTAEVTTPATTGGGRGGRGNAPERGRQFTFADSPDGKWRASYIDHNIWLGDTTGARATQLTTDGSKETRVKYGSASWVYGEELDQNTAMWWSPDASKLAYYRFDEKPVKDYYLQLNQTQIYDSLDIEAYPKAGTDNPIVDLYVLDVSSRRAVKLDVRDGRPFDPATVGYYVYNVRWTKDGAELLINRTNRRQNIMELAACHPTTGKCRVVVRETWQTGWVENSPDIRWLADGKRFIWKSERTGFAQFYLYDLTGRLHNQITRGSYEAQNIVDVDEATNTMYYMTRSGDNFMKSQLHRVRLDGRNDLRLTERAYHHTITLSPDRKYFVDVAQTHDKPPVTRLVEAAAGKVLVEFEKSDISQLATLGLRTSEMFTYTAADGRTQLHGIITFPSNFDPAKKYPVLVPVYGGPASASNTANEVFRTPNLTAEFGFIIVNLNSRATPGMGKRLLDALYLKLGQTEIDDMAAGIRALWNRPYIDKARVGMYGTSYGGYTSAMMILRHPDVIQAASASSPVSAWDHYDTIYTERYMWTPQENKAGYTAGSAMTHAANLRGRLMLYYGTADNNVHPSNMMQLIQALQRANKSFEVQVGPDAGHTAINTGRMMEFFIENLVMRPAAAVQ
jgi:dipeptidyl-peptidase-4